MNMMHTYTHKYSETKTWKFSKYFSLIILLQNVSFYLSGYYFLVYKSCFIFTGSPPPISPPPPPCPQLPLSSWYIILPNQQKMKIIKYVWKRRQGRGHLDKVWSGSPIRSPFLALCCGQTGWDCLLVLSFDIQVHSLKSSPDAAAHLYKSIAFLFMSWTHHVHLNHLYSGMSQHSNLILSHKRNPDLERGTAALHSNFFFHIQISFFI